MHMLYERECGVLCACEERGVEMCAQYWPTLVGTTAKYGKFSVTSESIDENKEIIQRALSISDQYREVVTKDNNFHLTLNFTPL